MKAIFMLLLLLLSLFVPKALHAWLRKRRILREYKFWSQGTKEINEDLLNWISEKSS